MAWNALIEGYVIEGYVIFSMSAVKSKKKKRNSPETFTSFFEVKIFSKSMSFRKHSTSSANYEMKKWYAERHYPANTYLFKVNNRNTGKGVKYTQSQQ